MALACAYQHYDGEEGRELSSGLGKLAHAAVVRRKSRMQLHSIHGVPSVDWLDERGVTRQRI